MRPGAAMVKSVGRREGPSSGGIRWGGLVVLGVVAGSAAVAIGSSGLHLLQPPAALDEGTVRLVRFAGAGVALVGLGVLLVQQRRHQRKATGGQDRNPTGPALVMAASIMGLLVLLAVFAPWADPAGEPGIGGSVAYGDADTPEPGVDLPPPPGPPPSTAPPDLVPPVLSDDQREDGLQDDPDTTLPSVAPQAPDPGSQRFDWGDLQWLAALPLLLLLLALLAFLGFALRGRLFGRGGEEGPGGLSHPSSVGETDPNVEPGVMIIDGDTPRGQITVAYHRLVAALGELGAPRRPYEAPFEHLDRALGPLSVRREPLLRLAELYVKAQFSEHLVTDAHRAEADAALEAGLMELRESRRRPRANGSDPAIVEAEA